MERSFDVVIVGAGPAGLMAARAAGEAGLRVAVLERKHDIAKIHRSCGGVLNVNEPTFGEVVRFDENAGTIEFTALGVRIPYDGPFQNVYGFHIYAPGGGRLEFGNFARLRTDPARNRLGVALSKERLLRGILAAAEKAGVAVFPDTNVCSVETTETGAVVTCADKAVFEGACVLAADGINSRLARSLGLNRTREFYGTTRDVSVEIEGTGCPDPDGFLFMITPKGIFSMIPVAEPGRYHVYASTFQRDLRPPDLMHYFLREDPVFSSWYANSTVTSHRTACVVNLMSPMETPACGNVLFIGDACWRREMSNVGSMCTGWKAGTLVAEALGQGAPALLGFAPYLAWYRENYYGPYGSRRQAGRDFSKYLLPGDIDYLAGLPEVAFPQTMDIFTVVRCIGSTYADLMTRIYEERPDVMERMIKVRENMDEDMQERIRWGFRNL